MNEGGAYPGAVLPQANNPEDNIHVDEVNNIERPHGMLDAKLTDVGEIPPVGGRLWRSRVIIERVH